MPKLPQHYGWPVSPYSAKTRAYLRYKGIPFADRTPNIFTLNYRVRKAVGKFIMPTVELPDGTWLQDSSDIIDKLELAHPAPSVFPSEPKQKMASALMELHADEWLPMVALHYRWNIPENAAFAMREFSRYALPGVPSFLGQIPIRKTAERLRGYLPILGVNEATIPGVERYAAQLIEDLDVHFRAHDFLLGARPCMGDFALFGPLYSHLYRDVATTKLFDNAPSVVSWFKRLRHPTQPTGVFLPNDEVPDTLSPVYRRIFEEQMPFMNILIERINAWADEHPDAKRLPKMLGDAPFSIGAVEGSRKVISQVQWKAQRAFFVFRSLQVPEQKFAEDWFNDVGGPYPFNQRIRHPLERRRFRPFLAKR